MITTPKIGLASWNLADDDYNYQQLANNWQLIDYHDHTPGKGVPVGPGGLAAGAVLTNNIASGQIQPIHLASNFWDGVLGTATNSLFKPFRAVRNAPSAYVLPQSVWSVLPMDTVSWDATGGLYTATGDGYIVPEAGYYTVIAGLTCNPVSQAYQLFAAPAHNGVITSAIGSVFPPASANEVSVIVNDIIQAATNDVIGLYTNCSISGISVVVGSPFLNILRVG